MIPNYSSQNHPAASHETHNPPTLEPQTHSVALQLPPAPPGLPDFTIRVAGGTREPGSACTFRVHRELLASVSATFRSMLVNGLREVDEQLIDLNKTQVDAHVVGKALRHLYGQRYKPNSADVVQMAAFLEYWDPHDVENPLWTTLLRDCRYFIQHGMDTFTAGDLLRGALAADDETTLEYVVRFIAANSDAQLRFLSSGMEEFAALLSHPYFSVPEDDVVELLRSWIAKHCETLEEVTEAVGELGPYIRWQNVSEEKLAQLVSGKFINDDELAEIRKVTAAYRENPQAMEAMSLFGAPLSSRTNVLNATDKPGHSGFYAEVFISGHPAFEISFEAGGRIWTMTKTAGQNFQLVPEEQRVNGAYVVAGTYRVVANATHAIVGHSDLSEGNWLHLHVNEHDGLHLFVDFSYLGEKPLTD